jgi:hypothetical protein
VSWRFGLVLLFLSGSGASGQRLEARLGTLVRDEGSSGALQRALSLDSSSPTELRLAPAPAASVLLVHPLTARVALEGHGMLAMTRVEARNREAEWNAQDVSVASAGVGLRYQYRRFLSLNAGIGATHFFTDSRGIFSDGSTVMPLLEAGAVTRLPAGTLPVHLSMRLQSHTFGTPALRREGSSDGKPVRLLVQLGFGR